MNSKGYTLVEMIVVILLVGVVGSTISISSKLIQQVAFMQLVQEVEKDIIFARDAAVATGKQYNIYCFSNRVLVRQGVEKPIYTTKLSRGIYIPDSITGKWIKFYGTMASPKTGTITLVCTSLHMQARITLRIATGKTTVYYIAL